MKAQPNADNGKDIVVDVGSDTEDIELTYEEISNKRVSPKRLIYTLPRDEYHQIKKTFLPRSGCTPKGVWALNVPIN